MTDRLFNSSYEGDHLAQIAFPMGGMGAGMICLEGTGALSKFSLRHRPALNTHRRVFAAVSIPGSEHLARVLEGPVPRWKLKPQFPAEAGGVVEGSALAGLPRFDQAAFEARFPFATVHLHDEALPLDVELTGWSPFFPNGADAASLPVVTLEYRFINRSASPLDAVFSFHAENLMALTDPSHGAPAAANRIVPSANGFVLEQAGSTDRPWAEGHCAIWVEESSVTVNSAWFDAPSFDQLRMLWRDIGAGAPWRTFAGPHPGAAGASLYAPFTVRPGQTRALKLHIAWYVPKSDLFQPDFRMRIEDNTFEKVSAGGDCYEPWYAGRFASLEEVQRHWTQHHGALREASQRFSAALYDSTLAPELLEAVAANLAILKSPTVLRQKDGRLWCWEGCLDEAGSCYGSANHVWNYAQAIAHLFPELERTLRETELNENLGHDGFQAIRAALPIRPIGDTREDAWGFPSAADGQLGTIIRTYREWRISGDGAWLSRLWPKVRSSLNYCIETWDPRRRGVIEEPHINTYDRSFWGAEPICTGLYLGALTAAIAMGRSLAADVEEYAALLSKGRHQMEGTLFNGEYFFQKTEWRHLRTSFSPDADDPIAGVLQRFPDMLELSREAGPPYQYGEGCMSDGAMGAWLSWACGLGEILDSRKVMSHLMAVYRHNLRESVARDINPSRPQFAFGHEGGLLVGTWPRGGRPLLPCIFVDEIWTGLEYEVASHLISCGGIEEGLAIVRLARRRYDGRTRNPFDEIEAGHWYGRALSSYALLQAASGARYDAVEQTLYLAPPGTGDLRCFLSTATGYGVVGVKDGKPFLEVVSGQIPYRHLRYTAAV